MTTPPIVNLDWKHQYRIIPSEYPPINFFERLVDPELMEELYYIESLTNDRLRDEVGDIALVPVEDRLCGTGSSPVMAAFTHTSLSCPSRFSDGSFGVYYAANTLNTAIEETKYHRTNFLSYTKEEPGQIDMRVYMGKIVKPLHDIRGKSYKNLHASDNWQPSQAFGKHMRDNHSWGIVYHSVRCSGGLCIAALRPPTVTISKQSSHLTYIWDGETITKVYKKTQLQ